MKAREILAVLGVAAATMAFTVVWFGPGRVGATDQPEEIKPAIVQPTLTTGGCEFVLTTDKPAYQPGESPTLRIVATNPTGEPVDATVWVSISSSSPFAAMLRAMPIPRSVWTGDCSVSLKPGETKTVTLSTGVQLSAGQSFSITMSDQQQVILTDVLSVQQGMNTTQAANASAALIRLAPQK